MLPKEEISPVIRLLRGNIKRKGDLVSDIQLNIKGQFITKNTKNAGSSGSANTATLVICFDEEWRGFAKRIIWVDAKGENKTAVLLVPEIEGENSVYKTFIPPEITLEEGWCSFSIEGYYEANPDKVMKSVSDRLFVSYSHASNGLTAPTPDEIIQLHQEFEALMPKVDEKLKKTELGLEKICKNIYFLLTFIQNCV